MFDIEELKNLSEMQSQTVHCLWHCFIREKIKRTWKRRTRSKNLFWCRKNEESWHWEKIGCFGFG